MFEEVFVFSRLEMTSESETNALPPPLHRLRSERIQVCQGYVRCISAV